MGNSFETKKVTGIKIDVVTTDNKLKTLVIDNVSEDAECKINFKRKIRDDFYLPNNNHISVPEGFSLSIDVDTNRYNVRVEEEQECNSKIPQLGETVYCIYEDYIITNKVGYLGKESFMIEGAGVNSWVVEDAWEWHYDALDEMWFYDLEEAKNTLLKMLKNGLIYDDFDPEVHEAYFEDVDGDYQLNYRDKDDSDEDVNVDCFMSDEDVERTMNLINQAIESAQCRIYRLKANKDESISHQEKAKNQEELMNTTIAALSNYARFIKKNRE